MKRNGGLANWECLSRSFVAASSGLPQGFVNVDRGAPKGMPVDFQKVHFALDIPQKLTSFGFPISSEKAGKKS